MSAHFRAFVAAAIAAVGCSEYTKPVGPGQTDLGAEQHAQSEFQCVAGTEPSIAVQRIAQDGALHFARSAQGPEFAAAWLAADMPFRFSTTAPSPNSIVGRLHVSMWPGLGTLATEAAAVDSARGRRFDLSEESLDWDSCGNCIYLMAGDAENPRRFMARSGLFLVHGVVSGFLSMRLENVQFVEVDTDGQTLDSCMPHLAAEELVILLAPGS